MHLNVAASETDNPIDPGTSIAATLSGLLASEADRNSAEADRVAAENTRNALYSSTDLFSTYARAYPVIADDGSSGAKTGFMADQFGLSSSYEAAADKISIASPGGDIATISEFFMDADDLTRIRAAGGITLYLKFKSVTSTIDNLGVLIGTMKGADFTQIYDVAQVTGVVNGTVYPIEIFLPSSSVASDAQTMRIYVRAMYSITAGNVEITDYCVSLGNTVGRENLGKTRSVLRDGQQGLLGLPKWSRKTWNTVGDSVMQLDYIQPIVADATGLNYVNMGVSSSTVAVNNTYLTAKSIVEKVCGLNGNTAYGDADLWTVYGGLNDWYYHTPLGSFGSTDNTTFYGALRAICENITARSNHPKLVLITPHQSNRNGYNTATPPRKMLDYVNAIKAVGAYYGVQVIDMCNRGGISPINLDVMTDDGVHPNKGYGAPLLAGQIISALVGGYSDAADYGCVEDWFAPTMQNGATNTGGLAFRKNPFGQVEFRGAFKITTTGVPAFTLPAGYRPLVDSTFLCVDGYATPISVGVYTDGRVIVWVSTAQNISVDCVRVITN
jgi:hypothetical protein